MSKADRSDLSEKRKPSVFRRVLAFLLITVLLVGMGTYGCLHILLNGPSPYAARQFAAQAAEYPFGDVLLGLFLDDEEVREYTQSSDAGEAHGEKQFSVYPQLG